MDRTTVVRVLATPRSRRSFVTTASSEATSRARTVTTKFSSPATNQQSSISSTSFSRRATSSVSAPSATVMPGGAVTSFDLAGARAADLMRAAEQWRIRRAARRSAYRA